MYDIYGKNKVTGHYGDKRSYYKPGKFHEGDDIALAMNSPINAYADGTVVRVAFDPKGYGNYVDIAHDNGLVTRYAHANGFDVKQGDKVTEGQIIGKVGSTGRSTGPHLHFEAIKDGKKINPREAGKYLVLSDSIIKPKGIEMLSQNENENSNLTPAEQIENLKNQLAALQAQKALNSFERTPEEEELKKQTIANLMSKLEKPVEVPKRLNITDILNGSNFGERLDTLAQYAQQPELQRNLGNLMGTRVFNRQTGRFENTGDRLEREAEMRLRADQQQALNQEKIQDMLSSGVYNAMNRVDEEAMREDRFNRQMAMQNEQYLRNLEASEKAAAERAAQQAFENDMKQKEFEQKQKEFEQRQKQYEENLKLEKLKLGIGEDGKPSGNNLAKMTAADRKQLTENKTTLANIEAGLESFKKNPDAYGPFKGLLPASVLNITDKKGIGTRAQIDNITAVYRKWLTGAQMSDKERKAYERFLPAPTDTREAIIAKLNAMKGSIERSNQALLGNYNISVEDTVETVDPLGFGL